MNVQTEYKEHKSLCFWIHQKTQRFVLFIIQFERS